MFSVVAVKKPFLRETRSEPLVHVIIINGGVQERGEWVQTIEGCFSDSVVGSLAKIALIAVIHIQLFTNQYILS